MNLISIIKRIYMEMFSWAMTSEYEMNATFVELEKFHEHAGTGGEQESQLSKTYAKVFKNQWFYLVAPVLFIWLKYQAMKWSSEDYLKAQIEKSLDNE